MERRDVIFTAIVSSIAALALLAIALLIFYCFHRHTKRHKKQEMEGEAEDLESGTGGSGLGASAFVGSLVAAKDRANGLLNLKTPLISTKTMG